jgi:hypothetical protein
MFFASLRAKRKETLRVVARYVVGRGYGWFLAWNWGAGGLIIWLVLNACYWFAANLLNGAGDPALLQGRFVAGWEVASFSISVLAGLTNSLIRWGWYKRIAGSE